MKISEKVYKLKQQAISTESENLADEFKSIFGDRPDLILKMIEVMEGMSEEEVRQSILNRYTIYEVLEDNSVPAIKEYLNAHLEGKDVETTDDTVEG